MGALACLNFAFSMVLVLMDRTTSYWVEKYFIVVVVIAMALNMLFIGDLVINFVVLGPTTIWK